ncbi:MULTISPECIES: hypothetical protein [unclassified Leifsonia]|uniref:hypothetical protein n=1 Tax=unclassified Leifsonia TaxID=2663824 RepID=UPI000A18F91A|nr:MULTISPECIES: hypothetical protein [unclassified Leifsonia]QJA00408.1 hypothetical protein HF024_19150 [Leifsonia sp. PS1209]
MRPKFLLILVIAGIAYVLGARAGRERYDQITSAATSFWNDPNVKKARSEAKKNAEKARKLAAKKLR